MKNINKKLLVGVYDSGIGGIPVYNKLNYELKINNLTEHVATKYLGDTKNFPYGTKNTLQLEKIVAGNLVDLSDMGCSMIGIACNTASYVYNSLARYNLNPNIFPILDIAVDEVIRVAKRRVYVISSNYTANVHAYKNAIKTINPKVEVWESGEQLLIRSIELNDRKEINNEINKILERMDKDTDTLVLGCTHFSHIKDTLANKVAEKDINIKIVEPTELMVNRMVSRIQRLILNSVNSKHSELIFSGNKPKFLFEDN